jgi:hypothetical protein
MTTNTKSVTDHLLEALSRLQKEPPGAVTDADVAAACECIESALTNLNLRRCEAIAAMDQL